MVDPWFFSTFTPGSLSSGVRLYLPSALQHGELCLEGPNSLQALVQKFQRLERLVRFPRAARELGAR